MRQSPPSSRQRSTTRSRSEGIVPGRFTLLVKQFGKIAYGIMVETISLQTLRGLTVELCFQYSLSRILITILCWFTPMQSLAELTRQTPLRQSETIITPILIPMPKWQARGCAREQEPPLPYLV